MYGIVSVGLEVAASAVILIPVFLVMNKAMFHSLKKAGVYCLFSFYLAAVYSLVGMPNVTYFRLELNLQLIPLVPMLSDLRNTILNILLFIPLGLFLPILCNNFKSLKKTFLFGFGMTLLVEILQIFTFRATDINDIITNAAGTVIGYYMAQLLIKRASGIQKQITEQSEKIVYLVCGVVFAVMFFIQPFISSLMWALVLY